MSRPRTLAALVVTALAGSVLVPLALAGPSAAAAPTLTTPSNEPGGFVATSTPPSTVNATMLTRADAFADPSIQTTYTADSAVTIDTVTYVWTSPSNVSTTTSPTVSSASGTVGSATGDLELHEAGTWRFHEVWSYTSGGTTSTVTSNTVTMQVDRSTESGAGYAGDALSPTVLLTPEDTSSADTAPTCVDPGGDLEISNPGSYTSFSVTSARVTNASGATVATATGPTALAGLRGLTPTSGLPAEQFHLGELCTPGTYQVTATVAATSAGGTTSFTTTPLTITVAAPSALKPPSGEHELSWALSATPADTVTATVPASVTVPVGRSATLPVEVSVAGADAGVDVRWTDPRGRVYTYYAELSAGTATDLNDPERGFSALGLHGNQTDAYVDGRAGTYTLQIAVNNHGWSAPVAVQVGRGPAAPGQAYDPTLLGPNFALTPHAATIPATGCVTARASLGDNQIANWSVSRVTLTAPNGKTAPVLTGKGALAGGSGKGTGLDLSTDTADGTSEQRSVALAQLCRKNRAGTYVVHATFQGTTIDGATTETMVPISFQVAKVEAVLRKVTAKRAGHGYRLTARIAHAAAASGKVRFGVRSGSRVHWFAKLPASRSVSVVVRPRRPTTYVVTLGTTRLSVTAGR